MLGTFFDEANIDTITFIDTLFGFAYYYIDDIIVTTDSLFFENYLGTQSINNEKFNINIYPNPFSEMATIEINETDKNASYTFKLYNLIGAEVKAIKDIKNSIQVNRENLPIEANHLLNP